MVGSENRIIEEENSSLSLDTKAKKVPTTFTPSMIHSITCFLSHVITQMKHTGIEMEGMQQFESSLNQDTRIVKTESIN